MPDVVITETTEEKRLKDFQRIAENWDKLPEYAQGKIDGTISAVAAFCAPAGGTKAAG